MVRFVNAHSEVALPERGASAMRRGGQQGAWRAATTSEPMLDGVHFAEFTIERKNFGLFFGAVRPGWDVERCDVTGAHSAAHSSDAAARAEVQTVALRFLQAAFCARILRLLRLLQVRAPRCARAIGGSKLYPRSIAAAPLPSLSLAIVCALFFSRALTVAPSFALSLSRSPLAHARSRPARTLVA